MRVKINFSNPQNNKKENHLLSIPKHLKSIQDLEVHLFQKILSQTLPKSSSQTISLNIDGYHLPKQERIDELIKDEDSITYERLFRNIH